MRQKLFGLSLPVILLLFFIIWSGYCVLVIFLISALNDDTGSACSSDMTTYRSYIYVTIGLTPLCLMASILLGINFFKQSNNILLLTFFVDCSLIMPLIWGTIEYIKRSDCVVSSIQIALISWVITSLFCLIIANLLGRRAHKHYLDILHAKESIQLAHEIQINKKKSNESASPSVSPIEMPNSIQNGDENDQPPCMVSYDFTR